MDVDSAVADGEEGGKADTSRKSNAVVAMGLTAGTAETRGSGGGLDQGVESGEEGEEEETEEEKDQDSSSDSVGSEVMVVRAR